MTVFPTNTDERITMAVFNLSLVPKTPVSEVEATKNLTTKVDPQDNEKTKETVTDGGIEIDKSLAPKLQLAGAVGHVYTELLNRELSVESMSAVVAATEISSESPDIPPDTGHVFLGPEGASIVHADETTGYIYVAESDNLQHKDFREISQKFMDIRMKHPKKPLGLAMLTKEQFSPHMQAIANCLKHSGVRIVYTQEGLTSLALGMLKE